MAFLGGASVFEPESRLRTIISNIGIVPDISINVTHRGGIFPDAGSVPIDMRTSKESYAIGSSLIPLPKWPSLSIERKYRCATKCGDTISGGREAMHRVGRDMNWSFTTRVWFGG